MNRVAIFKDNQLVLEKVIETSMKIGRGAGMPIQLEGSDISRDHALLQQDGDRLLLIDKSRNGTILNGEPIARDEPVELKCGALVQIGAFVLKFDLSSSDEDFAATRVGHDSAPAALARPAPPAVAEEPPEPGVLMQHLLDPRSKIPVWAKGEVEVRVIDIVDETHDTKTFRLAGMKPMMFSFQPGQFVTIGAQVNGELVERSYSISSSPSRPHVLEVTVKRVPGGVMSNWLCDSVKLGQTMKITGPSGHFTCFKYPTNKLLFIGGGSGITPVMSMLRWLVDTGAEVDAFLLVSARTPRDIIFRNELEWMSSRHRNVRVAITLTGRPSGNDFWTGVTGRCDARMIGMLVPDLLERHVFMCGPEPFMNSVKGVLKTELKFPIKNLHLESFGPSRVADGVQVAPRDVPKASTMSVRMQEAVAAVSGGVAVPQAAVAAPGTLFKVHFKKSDKIIETDGDEPILKLAGANGIRIASQCMSGSCGKCKIVCVSGVTDDDGVHEFFDEHPSWRDEKKCILTCVAKPTSDCVIEA